MTLPNLDLIPVDIRESTTAVVWKFETREGLLTKVPYQPHRPFERAKVNDPQTWSSFQVAYDVVSDGKADGVGVVLVNDGLIGIDLDGCVDPTTGTIDPEALWIVRTFNSYAEITPSGRGLRIFVRGVLPPGRRVQQRGGHRGIEIYETGKYLTVTGRHIDGTPLTIETRTSGLAAFHQRIFGVQASAAAAPSVQTSSLTDAELLIKASTAKNGARFVALWHGDISAYGEDQSAADLALANVLAFWTGRDAAQIDRLFRQSRLMRPKWDSRRGKSTYGAWTIAKAITDSTTVYEPGIEIELDDAAIPDGVSVISTRESDPVPASDSWPTLHDDALVGLFGDLVRIISPESEADPVALLGHSLVFWGSLVGRSPRILVGRTEHHLNENVLCVGDTGIGRKGVALDDVRAVMTLIDPDWHSTRVSSGLSTGEGLIYNVRDPLEVQEPVKVRGVVTGYQTVIEDAGVQDKRLLITETEFGKTLRVARREGNTLSAVVRQAWDSGTLHVLTRNSPLRATDAHISILAHVTPHELRQELKSTDMASGFINRFVLLLVRRSKHLPDGGTIQATIREALVQRFIAVTMSARRINAITRSDDAREHWHAIYQQLTRPRAGLVGAICNRAVPHVVRLSCLYALADGSSVIQVEHQRAALALWNYAEASVTRIFGLRIGHRLADYLLALLRQHASTGLTRTQIRDALGRNRHTDEISEALQLLADYGLAHSTRETDGLGRPATRWFADGGKQTT